MDKFDRDWIIRNALEEVENYSPGELTIRGLHYRMVSRGMTNTQRHYKRVVAAMIKARWGGLIDFSFFSDNDRETLGSTDYDHTDPESEADSAFKSVEYWMSSYRKNRWENQLNYVEVFIEKKALQGLFESPCRGKDVALNPCKGYPSLTFLYDAAQRFADAETSGKNGIILYFGDYDPSGEDIPRSIQQNMDRLGANVEVRRIALMEEQVLEWNLPPAPAKSTDTRTANWEGLGQVELDAVEPRQLQGLCLDAINSVFDDELYEDLKESEKEEKDTYVSLMKDKLDDYFDNL